MILGSGLLQSSWPRASDWLIKDDFTDTVAAGSVDGTAATPGPGTRVVTDTESKLSVGSGVMAIAGGKSTPGSGDPGLWYDAQTRSVGVALIAKFTTGGFSGLGRLLMWDTNTSGTGVHDIQINGTTEMRVAASGANVVVGAIALSTTYAAALVLRAAGAFYFLRGGTYGDWTLIWIDNAESTASLYSGATTYNAAFDTDLHRVIQLPAPFNTDTGLATDVHSGSVAAGTTFAHEADCLIDATITTVPSADNIDIVFRQQDASNYWICRIAAGGDISLQEVVAGSPTQRGIAAGVVSNGHRVVLVAEGTTIKGYSNNTLRWTYSSASNFATATAGELDSLGTGGAVSNLITWPRTLSGTAASILNKVSA